MISQKRRFTKIKNDHLFNILTGSEKLKIFESVINTWLGDSQSQLQFRYLFLPNINNIKKIRNLLSLLGTQLNLIDYLSTLKVKRIILADDNEQIRITLNLSDNFDNADINRFLEIKKEKNSIKLNYSALHNSISLSAEDHKLAYVNNIQLREA